MSNKHAHEAKEEVKKHSDVLESAMKDADRHTVGGEHADSVPMPDNGSHARSQAAHLDAGSPSGHEHTNPAGGLKHGVTLGELREPPQQISRTGKLHRKQ